MTKAVVWCALGAFSIIGAVPVQAVNTWVGLGGDDNWSTPANWDAALTSPAALTFGGSTRLTPTNDLTGATATNITFAAGAGAFTLNGNAITLGGNVTIALGGGVTNDQVINFPITLGTSPVLRAAPVYGQLGANKGFLVLNNAISGPYGLTSGATGFINNFVQLNGSNTYTGDTLITGNDASFSIGNASAFGSGKVIVGSYVGESQMWIQSAGNQTVTNTIEARTSRFIAASATVAGKSAGYLTLSGNFLLNQGSSGSCDIWCQKDLTLSGTVSGGSTYGLRLASGKLILQGVNTFTNHVRTTNAGGAIFNINSDAALGHTNNNFLATYNTTLQTAAGTSFSLSPSRTIDISSTNIVTFDVPSGASLTIPGQIKNSGSFVKSSAGTLTISGNVSGGGITLNAGTLALSGVNTYSNSTTLKGGVLNIGSDAALSDTSVPLNFLGSVTLQAGATNVALAAARVINLTNAAAYTTTFDVPTNFTLSVAGPIKGNVSTNSTLSKTGPGTLILAGGSGGTSLAALNILAGKVSIQGGVWSVAPAQTADSTVFNVTGGGTYEQTGGTNYIPFYSCVSQQFIGGSTTNMTSVGILSGGTLIGYELMIGRRNSAVMTISSNAVMDLYALKLGELSGFTTTFNLDGGVVDCNYIASRDTNSIPKTSTILNFNGGTLRAKNTGGTPNIIGGFGSGSISYLTTVNVKGGGAIIDSRSYAIVIPQILRHDPDLGTTPDGGLIKRGTGSLTLATNNTFNGATSIEAGTLKLGVANALSNAVAVLVASNAVFDVNGKTQVLANLGGSGLVTNNAQLSVTAEVAPGGTNAIGQLTLATTSAALSGTLSIDIATNGACDRLQVQGNLSLANLALNLTNPAALEKHAQYVIASCTGTLTIPFLSAPLPERWHITYDTNAREVRLCYNFGTVIMLR